MLRAVKLSAKDLQLDLDALLTKLGASHEGTLYTGYVFFSEADLKTIVRNHRARIRKTLPKAPKSAIDGYLDQYLCGFETNTALGKVLKPGFVVVDREGIDQSVTKRKLFIKRAEDARIRLDMEFAARRRAEAEREAAKLKNRIRKFFEDTFGEPKR
jgi:hypothetical protein